MLHSLQVSQTLQHRRWQVLKSCRSSRSPPWQPAPVRSLRQLNPQTSERRWQPDGTCSSSPHPPSSTVWFPAKLCCEEMWTWWPFLWLNTIKPLFLVLKKKWLCGTGEIIFIRISACTYINWTAPVCPFASNLNLATCYNTEILSQAKYRICSS